MAEIQIHEAAEAEYEEALERYFVRSARTAERFEKAVTAALDKIRDNPLLFGECDDHHRFCLLKRFPYSILFRVEGEQVYVIALAHAHRKPAYWADRTFDAPPGIS